MATHNGCFENSTCDRTTVTHSLTHSLTLARSLPLSLSLLSIHFNSSIKFFVFFRYFEQEDSTSEGTIISGQFKPGVLSPQLREALGLEEGQDPPYYERMLKFGYPPGYLARGCFVSALDIE
jgi:hypothetical protein